MLARVVAAVRKWLIEEEEERIARLRNVLDNLEERYVAISAEVFRRSPR